MNSPSVSKGRYVRIPTPLKRESRKHQGFVRPRDLFALHKSSIAREKRKLGVGDYGLLWISFFRGALVSLIIERFFFH